MKGENVVLDKFFKFSLRVVRLYQHLCKEKKEYVLSKQLLRSGTSIGANINEAQAAQSKKDFIAKLSIASKEAREVQYWPQLLCETGYLDTSEKYVQTMLDESLELVKLLTSIIKTTQAKSDSPKLKNDEIEN
jgi:four helix bundle protein